MRTIGGPVRKPSHRAGAWRVAVLVMTMSMYKALLEVVGLEAEEKGGILRDGVAQFKVKAALKSGFYIKL